jgi:acyl dehydratase
VGLPGIILQGTATLAMAASELVNREADGDPLRMRALHARFTRMVLPGTEILLQVEARVPAEEGTGLWFSVLNPNGRKAISNGYVLLEERGGLVS